LWNSLENVGGQAASFALFLVLARLISPHEIGIVQMVVTLLGFLTLFIEHGFTERIIRAPDAPPAPMLNTAFWLGLSGAMVLASTLTLGSNYVAQLYRTAEVGPVLRVLAWTLPLITLSCVQTSILIRNFAFRIQAIRRLTAILCGAVVALMLAFDGWGMWSLVARVSVEAIVDCGFAWLFTPWRPGWGVDRSEAKLFASFGGNIIGGYGFNYLSKRAEEVLVGLTLGSTALGYYAVAARAITLLSEVAFRAAQRTAIPVMSRIQDDKEKLREAYYSAIEFSSAVACPIFFGLSAVAQEVCIVLYGPSWKPVIPVMQVLGFGACGMAITIYTGPLLIALGRADWLLRFALVEMLINIAIVASIVHFGLIATAYGFVARSYVIAVMSTLVTNRILGTSFRRVLGQVAAPTIASMAVFVAVSEVRQNVSLQPWSMLVVLVLTGVVTYGAGMLLLGRSTLRRLVAVVRTAQASA
jgi:PST family polysaccharide transporter